LFYFFLIYFNFLILINFGILLLRTFCPPIVPTFYTSYSYYLFFCLLFYFSAFFFRFVDFHSPYSLALVLLFHRILSFIHFVLFFLVLSSVLFFSFSSPGAAG